MRCPSLLIAAFAFLGAVQASMPARAQFLPHSPQAGRRVVHGGHAAPQAPAPAVSPAPSVPAASSPSADDGSTSGHHHHHHHGHGGGWFLPGPYPYPWYGPPYYAPWYGYGVPPVVLPANGLFGPQAVNNFLGWNAPAPMAANLPAPQVVPRLANRGAANGRGANRGGAQGAQRPGVGGFGVLADDDGKDAKFKKGRVSNPESIARARQFIAFGDEQFHVQDYSDAFQRYKKAATAAPDLADAQFRQAFSLLAMGRYAPAAKALRHGLALKPEWPQSRFRLDDLYGDNRLAKVTHLEQLATAATERLENSDLMLLLGVGLYFDGQAERARLFFERAQDLGADRESIAGFLKVAPAPGDPARGKEL